MRKISSPNGFRSPDSPVRSQSRYRLRYPAYFSGMILSNFLRATLPSGVAACIISTCNLGYAQVSIALDATTDGDILNCRAAPTVACVWTPKRNSQIHPKFSSDTTRCFTAFLCRILPEFLFNCIYKARIGISKSTSRERSWAFRIRLYFNKLLHTPCLLL